MLKHVDAHVAKGECVALIGQSGSGKSMLLRSIAMLERPDTGAIYINGTDITAKGVDLNHVRESMGMVYQGFNLFSHLNVLDNITLAPRWIKRLGRAEAEARAMELLSMVGLADKARSFPHQLSGGQQQRTAIARCLAMEPQIMLLDEPTSALDPAMTSEVLFIIRKLTRLGLTMLIVTHEMAFAQDVADRVFFIAEGTIYEEGTPQQIFENPGRDKTRAFITRLKTFTHEIRSLDFDAVSMNARIEVFCKKYAIDQQRIYRVQLVLEELLQMIFVHCYQHAQPDIVFTMTYAQEQNDISLDVVFRAAEFNPFDPQRESSDDLGMLLVRNYAKRCGHAFDRGNNRITINI
ncbi:ATP-binding cassette domain-containing protein [Humidesulfovibrio idahonensis]